MFPMRLLALAGLAALAASPHNPMQEQGVMQAPPKGAVARECACAPFGD